VIGETLREFIRSFGRAPLAWLGLLVVATGTDLVDLVFGLTGKGFSNLQVASLALRVVGVIWFGAVVLRRLVGSPAGAWGLDRGFLFFLLWQVVLFAAEGLLGFFMVTAKNIAALAAIASANPHMLSLILAGLAVPLVELLNLRIAPWVVARTARIPEMTFGAAWRGMRGNWGAAAKAYIVLILPLFVVHYGLTAWLQRAFMPQHLKIAWTVFDGIESVAMLMLALSLFVAAFARAKTRSA
jgi:hypothetical protein